MKEVYRHMATSMEQIYWKDPQCKTSDTQCERSKYFVEFWACLQKLL